MTIFSAAREIQVAQGVSWSVALSWAHQCHAEVKANAERKLAEQRASFFVARKQALRKNAYLTRLHAAKVLTGKEGGTEGGWGFQQVGHLAKQRREQAEFGDNPKAA